jgi:hypothetical protein
MKKIKPRFLYVVAVPMAGGAYWVVRWRWTHCVRMDDMPHSRESAMDFIAKLLEKV